MNKERLNYKLTEAIDCLIRNTLVHREILYSSIVTRFVIKHSLGVIRLQVHDLVRYTHNVYFLLSHAWHKHWNTFVPIMQEK